MSIVFSKITGNGNDFIVIDARNGVSLPMPEPEFVRKISARGLSVGADGVIFIENSPKADFKWRFYNSDGTTADMCGNGARCAAKFAYLNKMASERMTFETGAGIIEAFIKDGTEVKVLLTVPHSIELDIELYINNNVYTVSLANTGVPHAVVFSDDVENIDVRGLGAAIRYHESFAPKGTNVNFSTVTGKNAIRVRTYERGVEDETLACGTGSVASALLAVKKGLVVSPVSVMTSGGKVLTVSFEGEKTYLQGEARLVYNGVLCAESYDY